MIKSQEEKNQIFCSMVTFPIKPIKSRQFKQVSLHNKTYKRIQTSSHEIMARYEYGCLLWYDYSAVIIILKFLCFHRTT